MGFFIPPSRSVQNLLEAAVTWQDIYQSGLCKFTPSFMSYLEDDFISKVGAPIARYCDTSEQIVDFKIDKYAYHNGYGDFFMN